MVNKEEAGAIIESLGRQLAEFDAGNLSEDESIELFRSAVVLNLAWFLPAKYSSVAHKMIEEGKINDPRH